MRISLVHPLVPEGLCRLIRSVPRYEVAWVAYSGAEAMVKCAADKPDLILIALFMPNLDGVETTRQIMNQFPCPILIMTNATDEPIAKIFEAMRYGALDAINMPMIGSHAEAQRSQQVFFRKIRIVERLQGLSLNTLIKPSTVSTVAVPLRPPLIVIGSSTGGPKALAKVLAPLSTHLAVAVVIIQHVKQEFSSSLADWLDAQTLLKVCLAQEGECLKANTVYVAATNDHLILTANLSLAYTPEPRSTPYRPSVDTFFKSVAIHWPQPSVAVLLTGMGRDGAEGLAILRQAGWHTMAQDEATSTVYGMPKAAKELGAAVEILPLEKIGATIVDSISHHRHSNLNLDLNVKNHSSFFGNQHD